MKVWTVTRMGDSLFGVVLEGIYATEEGAQREADECNEAAEALGIEAIWFEVRGYEVKE